tara:strand:- start:1600 stop:2361 length:762 start_codon:yes stop_codon:yes gene_type:complete
MVGGGLANMIGMTTCGGQAGAGGGGGGFANVYSIEMDGATQYVDCGNITTLNGAQNASWSFWVKFDSFGGWQTTVSLFGSSTANKQFHISFFNDQRIDVFINQAAGFRESGVTTYNTGVWYHIVATFDGTQGSSSQRTKLYIDGLASGGGGFGTGATLNSPSGIPFEMGRRTSTQYLDGKIDEVAVFNTTLTPTEVSNIFNGGNPTDLIGTTGLVHYWRNGDNNGGVGSAVKDNVGSFNGTLINGSSFIADAP